VGALRLVQYLSGPTLAIGLIGCTVGPDYQSPEMREESRRSAPDGEGVSSRTVEGAVDLAWWKSFRDSQLSSLVEKLVTQNLDLKTAAERVIQSVAQRQVAVSQGLPHIDGQSSTTYNRQSPNGPLSLLTPAPGAPLEYGLFRDGLTSSWQLEPVWSRAAGRGSSRRQHPGGRGEPPWRRARGSRRTGAKLHAIARDAEPSWDRETQSPPRRGLVDHGGGAAAPCAGLGIDNHRHLQGIQQYGGHALRRQALKHSAGGLQIRRPETFGEPIINRCKRCSRLVVATLAHPQTGNAEGDPQLPK
jgi:hypothetical protein